MKQRPRIYYSDSQKALMWERWKEGWTLLTIFQIHRLSAVPYGNSPASVSARSTALMAICVSGS